MNSLDVPCYDYFSLGLCSFHSDSYSSASFYILVIAKNLHCSNILIIFCVSQQESVFVHKMQKYSLDYGVEMLLKTVLFFHENVFPILLASEIRYIFSMQFLRDSKQYATCQLHHISLITPGITQLQMLKLFYLPTHL